MSDEPQKTIEQVAAEVGRYPIEAYYFIHEGLAHTVHRVHGDPSKLPVGKRHVSGRQLCVGLRDLAISKWGMLAGTVLRRWNITTTLDFGRIVFALVDNHLMQKQPTDRLEDFADVYDFDETFDDHFDITPDE
jgi:uncharacterized repeat protein (TIGR04138 family)